MGGIIDNLLATVENNDEDTDFIAFDEEESIIEEAFADLDQEDIYEEELYNESFENAIDVLIDRSKYITEGKYSLKDAMRFEEGLESFIDPETKDENVESIMNCEIEILRMRKVFAVSDEILKNYDIEDDFDYQVPEEFKDDEEIKSMDYKDFSIDELLYMSFLEDEDFEETKDTETTDDENTDTESESTEAVGEWVRNKFTKKPEAKPGKMEKVKKFAGKVNKGLSKVLLSKSEFSAKYPVIEKAPFYQRVKNKVSSVIKAINQAGGNASKWVSESKIMAWFKSAISKLNNVAKGFQKLSLMKRIAIDAAVVMSFVTSILLLVRKIRKYKVNYDKQSAALNNLSGDFNGDKSARIMSKDELNKMISACKSILNSAKKAASSEISTVNEAKAKFNSGDMSTLGISVNKRGKAKFGRISRSAKSLSDHGYSAGDFSRLKKEHKSINDMMLSVGQTISNGNPGGGRGTRAIIQTVDKAYRVTMVNIFATARSLG